MLELFLSCSDSKVPIYEQLYQFIRHEIEAGRIVAGTRLPSIRGLADSLKISKTTVEVAYQQLTAEGYIGSETKVGYFTLPSEHTFLNSKIAIVDLNHVDLSPQREQKTTVIDIDFHPARIDSEQFPKTVLRKLYNEVWKSFDNELLDYGEIQGEWGLRQEISRYLGPARGVNCVPDQIVIGSGMQYSIRILVDMLQTEISGIAMEDPGYHRVRSVFERGGVDLHLIPLEEDGIDLNALKASQSNLVYVTPSHQFPRGMVMPFYKRMELLRWAEDKKGYIIEDDYDGEFRYSERPIPALQGLDRSDSVIYIGTFSKVLAPSIRMNYMILPCKLVKPFLNIFQNEDSPVPRMQQIIIQRFMNLGYWEKHIRKIRRIYRHKHATLIEAIHSNLGDRVEVTGHGAGLHVSLVVKTDYSENELRELAETVGVRVYFEPRMDFGELYSLPVVSLGFASLSPLDIVEGIERLRRCWFV